MYKKVSNLKDHSMKSQLTFVGRLLGIEVGSGVVAGVDPGVGLGPGVEIGDGGGDTGGEVVGSRVGLSFVVIVGMSVEPGDAPRDGNVDVIDHGLHRSTKQSKSKWAESHVEIVRRSIQ